MGVSEWATEQREYWHAVASETQAPRQVAVVFDVEDDPARPVGTYLRTDEDAVVYVDPYGACKSVPQDLVIVVDVELPS